MNYLKSRDKVYENWLNPILNGACTNNVLPPGSVSQDLGTNSPASLSMKAPCEDMIEKPFWLDNEDPKLVRNGDVLSIGRYYINGVPLTQWSAIGGSYVAYQQQQNLNNWYYTDAVMKKMFPNGIKAYLNKDDHTEYKITELVILKMNPINTGIGLNIYLKFKLDENEIWAKIENVGVSIKPKVVCEEIEKLKIEDQIKITGKLYNIVFNWFKAKTGIYKCVAKEVLVYTEVGQLFKITEGSVIEVIHSDESRIKIKHNNTNYIIKKPTYFWFNWYFEKK